MHYLSAVDTSASPKLATDHQKAKDAATVSCSVADGIAVGCGPCSRAFSRSVCSARTRRGHSSAASCSACALDADNRAPMTFELEHGFANLGDVTIHYVTAGQGPPAVLIHGWPQTWYMWRDIMPGLAHRYRVIAPDLRGFGESSRPVAGYDKKTMSDDLWRLAQGVLGESRLFVVGHDWSGPTAFALAARHRDAVRRMAIFDAPVPGDGRNVQQSLAPRTSLGARFSRGNNCGMRGHLSRLLLSQLGGTPRRDLARGPTGVHPSLSPTGSNAGRLQRLSCDPSRRGGQRAVPEPGREAANARALLWWTPWTRT